VRYRKHYATPENSGGSPASRTFLSARQPVSLAPRSATGRWDIVVGAAMIGRLRCRKVVDVNRRVIELIEAYPKLFITITADNGPEFHGYRRSRRRPG
jgi:IS30 family transposase